MLKPRVPGYHGNQIKRRISSESRNLNYSDSFIEGKGGRKKTNSLCCTENQVEPKPASCFLRVATTWFKATAVENSNIAAATFELKAYAQQRNDVTAMFARTGKQNSCCLQTGGGICASANPWARPAARMMKSSLVAGLRVGIPSGVANDLICGNNEEVSLVTAPRLSFLHVWGRIIAPRSDQFATETVVSLLLNTNF